MSRPTGAAGKAASLNRGLTNRTVGAPSAVPLPPPADPVMEESRDSATAQSRDTVRRPDGQGRRAQFKKLSLELTPDDHVRLKQWLLTAFGSDARATPVLRALLAEAYADPALTERVRARLSRD